MTFDASNEKEIEITEGVSNELGALLKNFDGE